MENLKYLLKRNRAWAARTSANDPNFFSALSRQQTPKYLWIGCSDSRVPATQIVDLLPGEIFVHRNVANIIVHTDLNCLSVIQYAIEVLKVKYVIVCGHYGCGGVQAALQNQRHGLIDNWLRHIQDVHEKYRKQLQAITNETDRIKRLCELNVIEQVIHVCQTTIVQDAWSRGLPLSIHGWIYSIFDGLLRDLNMHVSGNEELESCYGKAIAGILTV
ncbi:MAG: carbonate dehydratase [wastewater metagenome]|nr:carbonate dehydratase [Candidatus Loosdrechtia aerotolerans]